MDEYGDLFTIESPIGKATVVGRPEWARQVLADHYSHFQSKSRAYNVLRILFGNGLVTSEGEFWRGQRRLVQPAFHRSRLNQLFNMMVDRVSDCVRNLGSVAKSGKAIDVGPVLSRLTLDIIARAMFGADVEGVAADVSRHIWTLNEFALRLLRHPLLFLIPRNIPLPFNHRAIRALRELDRIVLGIINARRRNPQLHDDLLGMLLSACDEETGKGMTDQQLRDEVMTIFVAGHETTANAMSWLLYLVSQHPEVEERLHAEVDGFSPDEKIALEDAGRFPYARQAIEESLRMYPSIWSVGRRCTTADEVGGFSIPVGMNMVMPIFYFHWSERFWPESKRFDPDRFAPDRRPSPDQMIYFPFGAGPRSCVGNHFALQELLILTVMLHRHFVFRVEPGFIVEPEPLITLRPKNGVRLIIKSRRPSHSSLAA